MSDAAGDLQRLVEDCDVLERCEECGTHVVTLGNHRCPSAGDASDAPPDGDDDDRVGMFRRSAGNTYAYHELDDGEVRCWCDRATRATRFEVVSRAEARSLGRTPCGSCARLRRLAED